MPLEIITNPAALLKMSAQAQVSNHWVTHMSNLLVGQVLFAPAQEVATDTKLAGKTKPQQRAYLYAVARRLGIAIKVRLDAAHPETGEPGCAIWRTA